MQHIKNIEYVLNSYVIIVNYHFLRDDKRDLPLIQGMGQIRWYGEWTSNKVHIDKNLISIIDIV